MLPFLNIRVLLARGVFKDIEPALSELGEPWRIECGIN
jgi:hypothetical protein